MLKFEAIINAQQSGTNEIAFLPLQINLWRNKFQQTVA